GREPNQVGVIPLLLFACWEPRARDIELGAGLSLGTFARGHALDARDQRLRRRAQRLDLDRAAGLVLERAVARDGRLVLGEGADAHLALQALRGADLAEQHPLVCTCLL